jgi:hypothetical protein
MMRNRDSKLHMQKKYEEWLKFQEWLELSNGRSV